MDGVLSGGAGGGRYVARQEAVPWGMDADECAGVWGCGVSAGGWLAGGEWLRWFAGGGSDGRGRIFRRVSEAGEDGILIADLWERYFLLTPDGRRREVTAPLVL